MQLIPDLDRPRQRPFEDKASVHFDSFIRVPLLNNLLVSFRWRPVLDDELLEEFLVENSNEHDDNPRADANNVQHSADAFPHVILIGKL